MTTFVPNRNRSLRIISMNLWHGLDHTRPLIMLPVENPLVSYRRTQAVLKGFAAQKHPSPPDPDRHLEVYCIQEGNPIHRMARKLGKHLEYSFATAEANVGVRAGVLSYPLFLQEGLVTLWSEQLQGARSQRIVLSNPIPEINVQLGLVELPVSVQLSERRVALLVSGIWDGLRVGFANLHLHHGPPDDSLINSRRKDELEVLFEATQHEMENCDVFFVAGDFNSEAHHGEYALLESHGFKELTRSDTGGSQMTWDPYNNPVCRRSASMNEPASAAQAWDEEMHQFDHVFMRLKASPGAIPNGIRHRSQRIFDNGSYGAWVSDHYGLCVDIEWDETASPLPQAK